MVGVLTIAALAQAVPAQAKNANASANANNSDSKAGDNAGSNAGGGINFSAVLQACSTSNSSLEGGAANACFGQVLGNDVGTSPTLLQRLNTSSNPLSFGYVGNWVAAGNEIQNGSGSMSFSAGSFTSATGANTNKSGTWSLSLNNALIQALVISVKGGNGWSAYLFDPVNLANSFSGSWTTLGLFNNSGNQPDISHISAYYVVGEQTTTPPQPIPTPALIPGAIGASLALLRKKKQEESEAVNS